VNKYIPDTMVDIENYPETAVIEAGKPILLFYSELIDRKKEP
jgi:hypothetical protein